MATDEANTASVPGRYASALFELAQEANQVADVERDLNAIGTLLDESDDLKRLVRSPIFSSDEQVRALDAVLSAAGISGLTSNFIRVLAKNRRLFALGDMIRVFRTLASRARGEVAADVTSATTLSAEQQDALKERLRIAIGKDVQLTTSVDPNILGGLIVKVGSRMIDSSLRTKLASLKMRMKEVG